jgi:hypothetical protein
MKAKFIYTPEGGSKREWIFDPDNPAWDLAYVTETETGWPWTEFMQKWAAGSHIALRALVYAFRKRDEPRLAINSVTVTNTEFDIEPIDEPKPNKAAKKAASGEGEA